MHQEQELYIEIDNDNNPINHPILGLNLAHSHGEEIPSNFVPFTKAEFRRLDLFEVDEGNTYQFADGVVTEVRNIRSMTEEEKNTLIDKIKADFYSYTGQNSWVFSMEEKMMIPPVPYPDEFFDPTSYYTYDWDEETVSWKQMVREPKSD